MSVSEQRIDLLGTVEVLHEHLTEALCRGVWGRVRRGERERLLTLKVLVDFWTAVTLRAPPSLTHALAEASGQASATPYPPIEASSQAFFQRCEGLRPEFFEGLLAAFVAQVQGQEPARFGRRLEAVAARFPRLCAVDGSSLDRVARRLKVLWTDRRVPIPGTVVAFFDLTRGTLAHLHYTRELQPQEGACAREQLARLPTGALVVGDRLYGVPRFFEALRERGQFGVVRCRRTIVFQAERRLSSRLEDGARLEDWEGTLGSDQATPSQRVRRITWRKGRTRREVVTSVLEPERLSDAEALSLYGERWGVERLFFELKEVLNLHRFYAANTNAVAMQVYAAALVHVALKTAQGRIAAAAGLEPEELSLQKLFPKVAAASSSLVIAEATFTEVKRINPGVRLRKPDWRKMPFASARLEDVLVEHRGQGGRRQRLKPDGRDLRRLPARPRWRGR